MIVKKFRNKKTGKIVECVPGIHDSLIESLEKNDDYKEMIIE